MRKIQLPLLLKINSNFSSSSYCHESLKGSKNSTMFIGFGGGLGGFGEIFYLVGLLGQGCVGLLVVLGEGFFGLFFGLFLLSVVS